MIYTQHEISAFWPPMSEPEYRALVADIAANGQHNEIWLYDGQVLDGWHRAKACAELGIEPKVREYTGTSPNIFANSQNGPRRNLPESVRAISATKAAQWRPRGNLSEILTNQDFGQTSAEIAESARVSPSYIESAKAAIASGLDGEVMAGKIGLRPAAEMARKAPDVAARVVSGELTAEQGKAELKKRANKPPAGEMEFEEAKAAGKEKRSFAPPESMRLANLERDFQELAEKFDDARAELIELRAASHDPQLRAQARDEISGLREALQMEQELHAALKAQRDIDQDELNTWKTRAQKLESKLAKMERGM